MYVYVCEHNIILLYYIAHMYAYTMCQVHAVFVYLKNYVFIRLYYITHFTVRASVSGCARYEFRAAQSGYK